MNRRWEIGDELRTGQLFPGEGHAIWKCLRLVNRFEFEIGEVVALVVMKGEQLQPSFRERNRSDLSFIPNMHAARGQRQFAFTLTLGSARCRAYGKWLNEASPLCMPLLCKKYVLARATLRLRGKHWFSDNF